jgi:hypothetical protein
MYPVLAHVLTLTDELVCRGYTPTDQRIDLRAADLELEHIDDLSCGQICICTYVCDSAINCGISRRRLSC